MKALILIIGLFLATSGSAQITVDQAGDDWKSQIDSALARIKECDSATWNFVLENVSHIGFWNGAFSTTEIDNNGMWSVVVSASDIRLHSINNLACVIVHEAYHVYAAKKHIHNSPCEEEIAAYTFEQAFQTKLPNLEKWIDISTVHWLELYKNRIKSNNCK